VVEVEGLVLLQQTLARSLLLEVEQERALLLEIGLTLLLLLLLLLHRLQLYEVKQQRLHMTSRAWQCQRRCRVPCYCPPRKLCSGFCRTSQ
jgi:hypothetical protein